MYLLVDRQFPLCVIARTTASYLGWLRRLVVAYHEPKHARYDANIERIALYSWHAYIGVHKVVGSQPPDGNNKGRDHHLDLMLVFKHVFVSILILLMHAKRQWCTGDWSSWL